jgi:hypothetical protein
MGSLRVEQNFLGKSDYVMRSNSYNSLEDKVQTKIFGPIFINSLNRRHGSTIDRIHFVLTAAMTRGYVAARCSVKGML